MPDWLHRKIPPMLASSGRPFDSADYLFEIKWDGIRSLAFFGRGVVRLQNRKLAEETRRYPEIAAALSRLPGEAILDGEIVVLEEGKPSFERVLERELASGSKNIARGARSSPAIYVAFDLLYLDGRELVDKPLSTRKELLARLLAPVSNDAIIESRWVPESGRAYYQEATALGLEGIVAKALVSPYLPGKRSRHWIKIKAQRVLDCAVLGTVVEPGSGRVKSLVLGAYRNGKLVWMGNVGSGLDAATLSVLAKELEPLQGDRPEGLEVAAPGQVRWLKPVLVARVKYLETTSQGRLRAPVFLGFVDRRAEACQVP